MIRAAWRLLVAVNPAASFGRNRAVGPAVAERIGGLAIDVEVVPGALSVFA